MQKVAWPMITVSRLRLIPQTWVKVSLRAIPVTIPGRAIGRMITKEIVSRPKKRWRPTAIEASVPRTRAIAVAAAPTLSEVSSACWAPWSWIATLNQWVVRLGSGHSIELPPLKA